MTKPKPKHPLPGYPVKEKFKSREAVENYLSDDRITCLICGRSYKALGGRGYTYQQIADKLGVTAMSVHRKNNL